MSGSDIDVTTIQIYVHISSQGFHLLTHRRQGKVQTPRTHQDQLVEEVSGEEVKPG